VRPKERDDQGDLVATEPLEQAIASTRTVLTGVSKDQLGDATPCAAWKVSDLINHIVGGQYFFEACAQGDPPAGGETDFSATDFVSAFDEGAQRCLAAFRADGVMDKVLTLPFGQMPGSAFGGIAATDTFTHGWDLAKATGQNTNLAPELAGQLLMGAKQFLQPAFRSPDGAVFGPEQSAPTGASTADQLAAFLGRKM
jgi:uncharacterized protein (TIGR03086 family)